MTSQTDAPSSNRRLVLVGGGHAHLAVLESWIAHAPPDVETWLVTPDPQMAYSGMIPGWMAGLYSRDEMMIDIAALCRRAGVKLVLDRACGLDAGAGVLQLERAGTVEYDVLSLATGGEVDISNLARAADCLLAAKPSLPFIQYWPERLERVLDLAVVGGGAAGVELALAARAALPDARITIIAPDERLPSGLAPAVSTRVARALDAKRIAVHRATARAGKTGLELSDRSTLSPDCVIAATGSRPPAWLAASGLALDDDGYVAIDARMCSTSHGNVFSAGDIAERVDQPMARSGVHAVKAGPVLARNLRAALCGGSLESYTPRSRTLYLLSTGDRRAILSWGALAMSGRAVWWLKNWIDRRFVRHHTQLASGRSDL